MLGEFDDLQLYLMELQGQPYLALLPLQQAGDALGISRSAVLQRIRAQKLDGVKLGKVTYACALSVLATLDAQRESVSIVRSFLEEVARDGRITNYSEVMPLVGLSPKYPNDRAVIGSILGKISRATNSERKRVLLTALVFNQTLNRPSDAFFELAYEEGYSDAYDATFLAQHLKKIYKKYQ